MSGYQPEEANELVVSFLADQRVAETPAAIDERDDMFREIVRVRHGNRDLGLVDYFRSGLSAARAFSQILRWRFGERLDRARILDFASGYGRVTRFLLGELGAARLWVSDVQAPAVAFQQRELGVAGFPSTAVPEELACDETFDGILVASLFSHLPPARFVPWLERLLALLEPDGLLVLSVHDKAVLEGSSGPAGEVGYDELSEIATLAPRDYGTTWVTERYVREAIAAASRGSCVYRRIPRGLWHFQDLYVVARATEDPFAGLDFDGGPDGGVDALSIGDEGAIWLAGWAVNHSVAAQPVTVRLLLDGRPAGQSPAADPRGDVASHFGRDDFRASGWSCRCDPPGGRVSPGSLLLVKAVNGEGREFVLHLSTVEGLRAFLEQRRLRQELARAQEHLQAADRHLRENACAMEVLEARIAALEGSRFWKARNLWVGLKRRLGLSHAPLPGDRPR